MNFQIKRNLKISKAILGLSTSYLLLPGFIQFVALIFLIPIGTSSLAYYSRYYELTRNGVLLAGVVLVGIGLFIGFILWCAIFVLVCISKTKKLLNLKYTSIALLPIFFIPIILWIGVIVSLAYSILLLKECEFELKEQKKL